MSFEIEVASVLFFLIFLTIVFTVSGSISIPHWLWWLKIPWFCNQKHLIPSKDVLQVTLKILLFSWGPSPRLNIRFYNLGYKVKKRGLIHTRTHAKQSIAQIDENKVCHQQLFEVLSHLSIIVAVCIDCYSWHADWFEGGVNSCDGPGVLRIDRLLWIFPDLIVVPTDRGWASLS